MRLCKVYLSCQMLSAWSGNVYKHTECSKRRNEDIKLIAAKSQWTFQAILEMLSFYSRMQPETVFQSCCLPFIFFFFSATSQVCRYFYILFYPLQFFYHLYAWNESETNKIFPKRSFKFSYNLIPRAYHYSSNNSLYLSTKRRHTHSYVSRLYTCNKTHIYVTLKQNW